MPFQEGKSGNEITKFKPGQSGNMAGRPRGKSVGAILVELGETRSPYIPERLKQLTDREDLTINEVIALQLFYKAIFQGNLRAIKEIIDRTEGKSIQRSEFSGPDGSAIPLVFTGIEIVQPEG